MLLHNIPRVFLNKFNGLSRNCITDITLAKCHGHYIHSFRQLSGCNTTKLPHCCCNGVDREINSIQFNELWMIGSEHSESIG